MSTTNSLFGLSSYSLTQNSGAQCWACSFWANRCRLVELGDVAESEDVGGEVGVGAARALVVSHRVGVERGRSPATRGDRSIRRCRQGTCTGRAGSSRDGCRRTHGSTEHGRRHLHPGAGGGGEHRRATGVLEELAPAEADAARWVHSSSLSPSSLPCGRCSGCGSREGPAAEVVDPGVAGRGVGGAGEPDADLAGRRMRSVTVRVPIEVPLRYTVTVVPLTRGAERVAVGEAWPRSVPRPE